jgi:type II secretory pathway component PulK
VKKDTQREPTGQQGVALLSALGVLVILGLLSHAFSAHMRLEFAYAMRDSQELKAHYLSVAGIQDAITRIRADTPSVDAYTDEWWRGASPEMTALGEGGFTLGVSDECARINVCDATTQMLDTLLGGEKESLATLLEFRSSTTLFAVEDLHGAGLGAVSLSRLLALGTTLGDGKININTANADVIAALPGMDAETAQLVVEFRAGTDGVEGTNDDFVFSKSEDLAKVPGLTPLRSAPAIPLIKVNTDLFRVESVGSVFKGKRILSNKKITAVVRRDETGKISIVSWENSRSSVD